MIQIILVNEESRASQYGIGTYIKQLCLILSQNATPCFYDAYGS